MRTSAAFLPCLLWIFTAAGLVGALFWSSIHFFIAGPPHRPQRFGRSAAFGTRCFFFSLLLWCITTGKTIFAIGFAGDAFTITGFTFARMEIFVLVHKHRSVEIYFRFLRQCFAKLVFENGRAHFLDRAFRQVVELEGTE